MIVGALQIIRGVGGRYLDPFLLAESQADDDPRYITIAYEAGGGCDIIFLQGNRVTQCARMNADLRFLVDPGAVRSAFTVRRSSARVFLSETGGDLMQRFMTTFSADPCLKVHVDALPRNQLVHAVRATGCRHGILERNSFLESPPTIELVEFDTGARLPRFRMGLRHGRFLLYDLSAHTQTPVPVSVSHSADPVAAPERSVSRSDCRAPMVDDQGEREELRPEPRNNQLSLPLPGTDALSTAQRSPGESGDGTDRSSPTGKGSPTRRSDSIPLNKSVRGSPAEFVLLFERLFRSFRKQACECFGGSCEKVVHEAEDSISVLFPEFKVDALHVQTAPTVLDVMQEIMKQAPWLKRGKLRAAALTLVSDLYNKHYELLEHHQAIDKVEQFYYQLKK